MDLEEGRTREARLVRQLDKLEMAFQAHEYQRHLSKEVLEDFYRSARTAVTDPSLREELAGLTG